MSFFHTTDQIRRRTKTVTRRMGWTFLKPGDRILAVVKGRGLKRGEKVEVLATLVIVSIRRERLDRITATDVEREGFPGVMRRQFVQFFCENMKCQPDQIVSRIEFRYADSEQTSMKAGMFPARGEGAAVGCDDLDCRPHRFTDLQPSHRRDLTPGLRPAGPYQATPSRVRQRVLNINRAPKDSLGKTSLISPPAEPARARSAMAGGAGTGVAGSPGASALISDQPGRGAK